MMDLNDVSDIDVQIALEEEAVCIAQEKLHENDERYHRAIIKSLNNLKVYKKALYMACNGKEYLVDDFLQKARKQE